MWCPLCRLAGSLRGVRVSARSYGLPIASTAGMSRGGSRLNPIHHQGLRTALGAFRTPPAQSMYVEAHKLFLRRLKLSLNYVNCRTGIHAY